MKLRLTSRDLRLRLTPQDVEALAAGTDLQETLSLPTGQITFALVCDGTEIGAELRHDTLCVSVPAAEAQRWTESDEVALSAELPECQILIEKDRRP